MSTITRCAFGLSGNASKLVICPDKSPSLTGEQFAERCCNAIIQEKWVLQLWITHYGQLCHIHCWLTHIIWWNCVIFNKGKPCWHVREANQVLSDISGIIYYQTGLQELPIFHSVQNLDEKSFATITGVVSISYFTLIKAAAPNWYHKFWTQIYVWQIWKEQSLDRSLEIFTALPYQG